MRNSDTMVTAFVLLTLAPGKEEEVVEALKRIDMVAESHVVYGGYDIHLTVKTEDLQALDEFIHRLRTMGGISHTVTLIAVGD